MSFINKIKLNFFIHFTCLRHFDYFLYTSNYNICTIDNLIYYANKDISEKLLKLKVSQIQCGKKCVTKD